MPLLNDRIQAQSGGGSLPQYSPSDFEVLTKGDADLRTGTVALRSDKVATLRVLPASADPGTPPASASLTIGSGTSRVSFTARTPGSAGNDLEVAVVSSNTQDEAITFGFDGETLTITLRGAGHASGAAVITAQGLVALFDSTEGAPEAARTAFDVTLPAGSGAGDVALAAAANLAGGNDGVSTNFVDITIGANSWDAISIRRLIRTTPADAVIVGAF